MSSEVGPYRLTQRLGAGGMGEVWSAVDTGHHDRLVAVKVLPPGVHDAEFADRFRREARVAASLRHPGIVPVHDYGEADGRLYLVMQLIEGADLAELTAREGPLTPERAVGVLTKVADALDAAHAAGLLHRDVKPSNVRVVGPRDFVYLLDFGIARPLDGADGLTAAGRLVGTAAYMAPERFAAGPVDRRADVYSLAGLLHSCLTGRPPFETANLAQAIWAHTTQPPPQPSLTHGAHLAPFDAVIARGMAKAPEHRPATAGELAGEAVRALGAAGDHRRGGPGTGAAPAVVTSTHPPSGAPSLPPPVATPAPPRRRRRLLLAAGIAGFVLVLLATGVTSALLAGREPAAPTASPTASPTAAAPPRAAPTVLAVPAPLAPGAVATVPTGADPFADAVSRDGRFVWVGNENGASVTVVDTTTDRAVATVPTGPSPSSLAVSPDGATLWAADDDGLTVIDVATATVRRTVRLPGVPDDVAASPDGRAVFVTLVEQARTVVLDTGSLATTRSFPTLPRPGGTALSPDGRTLAVASREDRVLEVLDAASGALRSRVALPFVPFLPRFSPDGHTVVLPDAGGESLAVVDVDAGRMTTTTPTGGSVVAVGFAPGGRTAYAHADGGSDGARGTLLTLDTSTWQVVRRTPVEALNSADVAVSPDGSRVYVVDQDARALLVVATVPA